MSNKLSDYAKKARLWVIHYEDAIKKKGFAMTYSGKITNIEHLYSDVTKQLDKIIVENELEIDITKEDALKILKGTNFAT